jgi:(5-formylfuran-3-yl)methyl phosphate synthase
MSDQTSRPHSRLLVSVRNADEALAAVYGGADIIDVKEPQHGPLGAASEDVIVDICGALKQAYFSGPISAAFGELHEIPEFAAFRSELVWVKAGLSQCRKIDWQSNWRKLQQQVRQQSGDTELIAVAYADWQSCAAPSPHDVIDLAVAANSPGVLFDTFHKDGRNLLDHLSPAELRQMMDSLRTAGLFTALAGSIGLDQLPTLVNLAPDIIAMRSAVCVGGRNGRVDADRVRALRAAMSVPMPAVCDGGSASVKRR